MPNSNHLFGTTLNANNGIYACETRFIPYMDMIKAEIATRLSDKCYFYIESIRTGVFYLNKNLYSDTYIDISFKESSGMFYLSASGEKKEGCFYLSVKVAYTKKGEILNKLG